MFFATDNLTQEEKPPVSERSWSRFRERLLNYEKATGIDLMKEEMESLNIPFFVNTKTGEIEQVFRQKWTPIPPRLDTRSGAVVH